ncbi:uncharacterized protein LOC115464957 [Microcaecilia unicolor]|uniref:Uncharacterized protein LOC115464957 n=1 Tax=Microcaecilia unicolor TaxID=1415580 RepID=A0A6P7X6I5_9AMPH|nr:uncharacterized protein LOC115464957 [Microcaecilia unicolor]
MPNDRRQAALGNTVSIRCSVNTRILQWEWKPKFPLCASDSARVITVMGPKGFIPPLHFRNRLRHSISSKNLELRGTLIGDSGIYTCVAENGKKWITDLQVQEGCFNNINLTIIKKEPFEATLYCKLCSPITSEESSFIWTVNDIPLEQLLGNQRMRTGAILSVPLRNKSLLGAWRCKSTANPAWYAEHCLELESPDYKPEEDMKYGEENDPEAGPKPAPINLFQLILMALGALALFSLVILCLCFFCKGAQDRYEKTQADIAEVRLDETQLPAGDSSQQDPSPIRRTPSEKEGGGVHYVELEQFPPARQILKSPSLGRPSTIYATVV